MALDDFLVLIKAYWKAALIGPIVAIALCVALAFSNGATANYSATSAITVVDPANRGGILQLVGNGGIVCKTERCASPRRYLLCDDRLHHNSRSPCGHRVWARRSECH